MINPERTDIIWNDVWKKESQKEQLALFNHTLFVEGYEVFKKYFPKDPHYILEAGGGSGRYGIKMGMDYPSSNVTIIDIAPASIEVGKGIAKDMDVHNVEFIQNNILNLSFPDNSFDLIISDAVIQVLPQYQAAVKELARVLKPDGTLIIAVCNKHNFHTLYKQYLKLIGKPYEYGFEKSFSSVELGKSIRTEGLVVIATDGFSAHYGLRRLKNKFWRGLGRVVQFFETKTASFSKRWISRKIGFETVVVAKKSLSNEHNT